MKSLLISEHGGVTTVAALVILALTTVGLGAGLALSVSKNLHQDQNLRAARLQSYTKGQVAQKASDDAAAAAAAKLPHQTYVASQELGAFQISFPKNWSVYVDDSSNSNATFLLLANPGYVHPPDDSSKAGFALRVELDATAYSSAADDWAEAASNGDVTAKNVTISGIAGVEVSGKIDENHTGKVVILPLRDKTLKFETDDLKFASDFAQILQDAKIHP